MVEYVIYLACNLKTDSQGRSHTYAFHQKSLVGKYLNQTKVATRAFEVQHNKNVAGERHVLRILYVVTKK